MALVSQEINAEQPSGKAPQTASSLSVPEPLSRDEIGRLAYQLWLARGCPHGSAEIDWLQAEQELCARASEKKSQPSKRPLVRKSAASPPAPRAAGRKRASIG